MNNYHHRFLYDNDHRQRLIRLELSERVIKSFENVRNNIQKALAEQPKSITFRQAYKQVHGKEWDE
jgi:hypothetical protein